MNAQEKLQHEREWALEDNLVGYPDVYGAARALDLSAQFLYSHKWMDAPRDYLAPMDKAMTTLKAIAELAASDDRIRREFKK